MYLLKLSNCTRKANTKNANDIGCLSSCLSPGEQMEDTQMHILIHFHGIDKGIDYADLMSTNTQ